MEEEPSTTNRIRGHDPVRLFSVAAGRSHGGAGGKVEPEAFAESIPGVRTSHLVGEGGMGKVFVGRQTKLDRRVAVKVIAPELSTNPEFEARFESEARALAQLNHENIVQVFEAGTDDEGRSYLIMEFVEGENLRTRLGEGPLTADSALGIFRQVCLALRHAHAKGCLHRDIKPENILLMAGDRVKVVDFGLARQLDETPNRVTCTGQVLGTQHYLAPEQLMPAVQVDHRCDIYSAGVVLYEMLVGTLPVGTVRPPSDQVAGLDPKLDAIVFRAMESDPNNRYPDVDDLIGDLETLRTPVQPVAPGSWSRRHLLGLGAALIGVGGGGFWMSRPSAPRESAFSGEGGTLRLAGALRQKAPFEKPDPGDRFISVKVGGAGWVGMRPDGTLKYGWNSMPPWWNSDIRYRWYSRYPAALTVDGRLQVAFPEYEERIDVREGIRLFSVAHRYAAAVLENGQTRVWSVYFEDAPDLFQPGDLLNGEEVAKVVASNIGVCFLRSDGSILFVDRNGVVSGPHEESRYRDVTPITNGFVGLLEDGRVVDFGRSNRIRVPDSLGDASRIVSGKQIAAAEVNGIWQAWAWPEAGAAVQQVVTEVSGLRDVMDLALTVEGGTAMAAWVEV